jgi:serine-type D-Ala-D-Ala carboxypeptidase/endopeptidase
MFLNQCSKQLPTLFAITILLMTILASPTIVSALASPSSTTNPSNDSTLSSFTSSIQKEKYNVTSTFEITDQIKALIDERVDKNKTNAAMAIGFVDPRGTQFYGIGKMSNTSNATVDQNTVFAIGSNTKVFTTILLADMVNKGVVNLEDPIEKYLPSNVTIPQYNGHKITIEDLATHTSGLPEFPDNYCLIPDTSQTNSSSIEYRIDLMNCTNNYTFNQFYQGLSNTIISREPGSQFQYSTFGIGLLGHILTLKSNMSSFDELLEHNILDVLGMNDTGFNLLDSQKSRLAVGHLNGQKLPLWDVPSPIHPAGGVYSSTSDMLKFLSANMGLIKTELDDAIQESHLIRHSTGNSLPNNLQASNNANTIGSYVGLGWIITTNFGQEVIWHNGITLGGYNAFMAFNPAMERGIVILSSADYTNNNISNLVFNQKDDLSSLIWNLLIQSR